MSSNTSIRALLKCQKCAKLTTHDIEINANLETFDVDIEMTCCSSKNCTKVYTSTSYLLSIITDQFIKQSIVESTMCEFRKIQSSFTPDCTIIFCK